MDSPTYRIIPIDGFAQTTIEGTLDLNATATILLGIAHENDTAGRHLLVDVRRAEATGLSYTDVYALVGLLSEHPAAFAGRIAFLDTFRAGFEKVQFFEASANEHGFTVRSFLDEAAAVAWLENAPAAA